jgi:hypothetical protein
MDTSVDSAKGITVGRSIDAVIVGDSEAMTFGRSASNDEPA